MAVSDLIFACWPSAVRSAKWNAFTRTAKAVAMFESLSRTHEHDKEVTPLFSAANDRETKRSAAWLAARLERSKHFRMGELETETVTITPSLAELMLGKNTNNRAISPRGVKQYAESLRNGDWALTHQGIAFSRSGELVDGQHRLAAIIEAAIPAQTRVTFGVADDAFAFLDGGIKRTGGHVVGIAGYQYSNNLAAAARLLCQVRSDNPFRQAKLTASETLDVVRENEGMCEWCSPADRVKKRLKSSATPPIVAFYLISQQSSSADRLTDFIEDLVTGEFLRSNHPVHRLRDMIMVGKLARGKGGDIPITRNVGECAAIILAWNRFVKGRNATERQLTWSPADSFPVPE